MPDAAGLKRVNEEAKQPFDLEKGPLMRVSLFSRSQTRHVLLLNFHHVIFDGVSLLIILEELQKTYLEEVTGNLAQLSPLKATYGDFFDWQTEMMEGNDGLRHKHFWQDKSSGSPRFLPRN